MEGERGRWKKVWERGKRDHYMGEVRGEVDGERRKGKTKDRGDRKRWKGRGGREGLIGRG